MKRGRQSTVLGWVADLPDQELDRRRCTTCCLTCTPTGRPTARCSRATRRWRVKWHVKNLFAKLDAGTVKQVVLRARILGLLPPA
jgi:hypothetical protein